MSLARTGVVNSIHLLVSIQFFAHAFCHVRKWLGCFAKTISFSESQSNASSQAWMNEFMVAQELGLPSSKKDMSDSQKLLWTAVLQRLPQRPRTNESLAESGVKEYLWSDEVQVTTSLSQQRNDLLAEPSLGSHQAAGSGCNSDAVAINHKSVLKAKIKKLTATVKKLF